jgi:hypothetical protein
MKKMLPIAMLAACALIFSSLVSNAQTIQVTKAPSVDTAIVNSVAVDTVAANSVAVPPLSWPIEGTYGAFTYYIPGTSHISFYRNGSFVASYSFVQNFPNQVWGATIDSSVITNLFSVTLAIFGNPTQYNLDLNAF